MNSLGLTTPVLEPRLAELPDAVWRLLLRSEDARSLSVTLGDLRLPAGAQLRLYDGEGLLPHPALAQWIARRVREAGAELARAR